VTGERCTKCQEGYFPNYLQDECSILIENCKSSPENYIHDGENYLCPDCIDGYLFDTEFGKCDKCNLEPPCLGCAEWNICSECQAPHILTVDRKGCQLPLAHCLDKPKNYMIVDDEYMCSTCKQNFVWDGEQCSECGDVIDECTKCVDGICHQCSEGMFPAFDGLECMEPLENCADEMIPADY